MDHPTNEWAMRGNSYGLVTVEVTSADQGQITFEARNEGNQLARIGEKEMMTTVPLVDLNY